MIEITTESRAFPGEVSDGMTVRTYLAGQAMAGYLANAYFVENASKDRSSKFPNFPAGLAAASVVAADALIAELNKTEIT